MVSWHLLTHPSYPRWLAFGVIQSCNFVAEGFVFLAGASVGLVASRSAFIAPLGLRSIHRALQLLLAHYSVAAVLAIGFPQASRSGITPDLSGVPKLVGDILLLRYQPYLGDVLSLFVFLSAMTPILLALYRATGELGLLCSSLGVYLATVLLPALHSEQWRAALELNRHGAFDVNSWQLVYVLGILFGGRYTTIVTRAWPDLRRYLLMATVVFALLLCCRLSLEHSEFWARRLPSALLFGRHPLGLPRMVYILAQMMLIGLITIRFWDRSKGSRIARVLILFGRNSLVAFVGSIFLDYLLKAMMDTMGWGTPLNVVIWIAELSTLYGLVRYLDRLAVEKKIRLQSHSALQVSPQGAD
jgi:hypothetical protein